MSGSGPGRSLRVPALLVCGCTLGARGARGAPAPHGAVHLLPQWFCALSSQLDTGKTFQAVMRFDTDVELTYFLNGGILNYMIRKMAK